MYDEDTTGRAGAQDEGISLIQATAIFIRHWRLIVVLPLVLAFLAGSWALSWDREYIASASFVPQGGDARAPAGAAALAAQFGVSLGTDRPGESPQFYVDLLGSLALLRKAVESEYQVPEEDGTVRSGTLIELFDAQAERGLPAWRVAVDRYRANHLSTTVGRETGMIRLRVTAPHPALAEQMAARLLELLTELNTEIRQVRAQEEGHFISGRIEQARAELWSAEEALQDFLRQNRDFGNSPELVFAHDRLQREVSMRQEVYSSLMRAQEQARLDAVRDTPLFSVIDRPAGTAEPKGRRTIVFTALALFLGVLLATFLVFALEFFRRRRETEDPEYRELEEVTRRAWRDLRHPTRWIIRREKPVAARDP